MTPTPTMLVRSYLKILSGSRVALERAEAADELRRSGADSPAVVRRLARALDDPAREVRLRAGVALRSLSPSALQPALAILKQLSRSRDDDVVDEVVRTLVHVGSERRAAIEKLLTPLLQRRGGRTRATAASVLAQLGRAKDTWAADAFSWLADPDAWVRTCGVTVIARLRMPADERVDRLVTALSAHASHVSAAVREVRSSLALDDEALRARLTGGSPRERAIVLMLLQSSSEDRSALHERDASRLRAEAAALVIEALGSKQSELRAAAVRCLEVLVAEHVRIAPAGRTTLPAGPRAGHRP